MGNCPCTCNHFVGRLVDSNPVSLSQKHPKGHSSKTQSKISCANSPLGWASVTAPSGFPQPPAPPHSSPSGRDSTVSPEIPPAPQPRHPASFLREPPDVWEELRGSDRAVGTVHSASHAVGKRLAPSLHLFVRHLFTNHGCVKHHRQRWIQSRIKTFSVLREFAVCCVIEQSEKSRYSCELRRGADSTQRPAAGAGRVCLEEGLLLGFHTEQARRGGLGLRQGKHCSFVSLPC